MTIIGTGYIHISKYGRDFERVGIADGLKYIESDNSAEIFGTLWDSIPQISDYKDTAVLLRITHKEMQTDMKMKSTQYDFFNCQLSSEAPTVYKEMKKERFSGKCTGDNKDYFPVLVTKLPVEQL